MAITLEGDGGQRRPYAVAPKPNSDTRSLVQNAVDRGWDPTKIWDQAQGKYTDSISPWDRARDTFDRNLQNRDGVEGVVAADQNSDTTGGPVLEEKITFEYPKVEREARENGNPKVTASNAFPGMGI